jgi:hypothetical protein
VVEGKEVLGPGCENVFICCVRGSGSVAVSVLCVCVGDFPVLQHICFSAGAFVF